MAILTLSYNHPVVAYPVKRYAIDRKYDSRGYRQNYVAAEVIYQKAAWFRILEAIAENDGKITRDEIRQAAKIGTFTDYFTTMGYNCLIGHCRKGKTFVYHLTSYGKAVLERNKAILPAEMIKAAARGTLRESEEAYLAKIEKRKARAAAKAAKLAALEAMKVVNCENVKGRYEIGF